MHFKGNLKKKFLEAFAWGEKGKKKKKAFTMLACKTATERRIESNSGKRSYGT